MNNKKRILIDANGVNYVNMEDLTLNSLVFKEFYRLKKRVYVKYPKYDFFAIEGMNDYILKVLKTYEWVNCYEEMYVQKKFLLSKDNLKDINLPLGYVLNKSRVVGQIIPYYKDSISFRNASIGCSLDELMNIIKLDDDGLHNLFLIYHKILNIIEEMYEKNVIYQDVHGGNFLFYHNDIKVVDFDYNYLFFYKNKLHLLNTFKNYIQMVNIINKEYHLPKFVFNGNVDDFNKMKSRLVKLENVSRPIYKVKKYFED